MYGSFQGKRIILVNAGILLEFTGIHGFPFSLTSKKQRKSKIMNRANLLIYDPAFQYNFGAIVLSEYFRIKNCLTDLSHCQRP